MALMTTKTVAKKSVIAIPLYINTKPFHKSFGLCGFMKFKIANVKWNCYFVLFLALLIFSLIPVQSVQAATNSVKNTSKIKNETITIGYCGAENAGFTLNLSSFCQQLYKNGMLSSNPHSEFDSAKSCWDFISNNTLKGTGVSFEKDAFLNLSKMSDSEKEKEIQNQKVDLMIVMGSEATKLFLKLGYRGDYIIAGVTDVYKTGAIESLKDSGADNRCAAIYDDIYTKQVQSICQMFEFKKMGVVYENSETKFEYSGIDELRRLSKEKPFELFEKNLNEPTTQAEYSKYLSEIKEIYTELANKVDIFYLTINKIHPEDLATALKPFYDKKIPVISQEGSVEVKNGALFGISMTDEQNYGILLTEMVTDYLSGQPLRYMSKVFHSAPRISFNISVAQKIGFPLDFQMMLICDDVYEN